MALPPTIATRQSLILLEVASTYLSMLLLLLLRVVLVLVLVVDVVVGVVGRLVAEVVEEERDGLLAVDVEPVGAHQVLLVEHRVVRAQETEVLELNGTNALGKG